MLQGVASQRFKLLRRIGEGGMGTVYEGVDGETRERVALKVLRGKSPEGIVRFKREFRALQDIHHPNLVTLGELVSEGDEWFFTMELVDGEDFISWVTSAGSDSGARAEGFRGGAFGFDERRLRAALAQLVRGLTALHDAQKVHRDVKPSNVLVEPSGRVVILDFGLVTDVHEAARSMSDVEVVGTPAYMAPEQAASLAVGPAADWYAVGVLLYEALTGEVPFTGAPLEVLLRKQKDEPPAPSTLARDLPPDLDDLCVRLLRFNPAARPTGRQILRVLDAPDGPAPGAPPSLSAPSLTMSVPFVGRQHELDELRSCYERTRATGQPSTVLILGESGIGKSCLVRHFTETAAAQDKELLLVTGRCYEKETVPYKALDGVVDELARILSRLRATDVAPLLPTRPAPLVQMFPVLRRVEAIAQLRAPDEAVADLHELRSRAFGAMRELLVRIADRRRTIVVIDDLQWADADSLALLQHILRPPEGPALLLIATMRDDSSGVDRAAGADGPSEGSGSRGRTDPGDGIPGYVRQLRLERLGRDDARSLALHLVQRLAPGTPVDAETLAAEADGHPLFIDAIVRHLSLAGGAQGTLKLEEALWARIRSLDETPRRIVEMCAVAGSPLPLDALAKATRAPPADFARFVSFLRVAHLVRATGTRGNDVIECFHGRVREAVVNHLNADERRAQSYRLSIALESTGHADSNLLALLWLGAGELEKAGRHTLLAADRASVALAFERAARLYERAIELLTQATPPLSRAEERVLQTKLGHALSNAGRGAKAARAYRRAAEGANAADGLDLRWRAGDQLLRSGHFDEGLVAIQEVLASIGMKLPSTTWRALLALVFWRLVLAVRGVRHRLVDASAVSARDLVKIDACYSIASSLSLIDPICGQLFHVRNLLVSLRIGERKRVARALALEVSYLAMPGGPAAWARAQRLDREAQSVAKGVGEPFAIAWARATSSVAHYLVGRFAEALALCNEAERAFVEECAGATWETLTMRLFAIQALGQLGRLRELKTRQEAALAWALERGDLYAAVNLRIGYSNLAWLVAGDPARARSEATEAMRQWSQRSFQLEHYYELVALTNADLYEGRARDAWERLSLRWGALRGSFLPRVQIVRIAALNLRARAAIALAAADPGARAACLEAAERDTRAVDREKMAWTAPTSNLVHAAILHLRGDDAAACARLERVMADAATAQLELVAPGARWALGVCKGGPEGARLMAEAETEIARMGAKAPRGLVAMVAPGFGAADPE